MMSLYICSTEVLKPDKIEPVPMSYSGAAGVGMTLTPVEANTIALDPYPFDQPSLTTNVIFRRLPQTKFKDSSRAANGLFQDRAADRVFQADAGRGALTIYSTAPAGARRSRTLNSWHIPCMMVVLHYA